MCGCGTSPTGVVDEIELEAHLQGLILLPSVETDIVSHAVNELIDELPLRPRAPYGNNATPPGLTEL